MATRMKAQIADFNPTRENTKYLQKYLVANSGVGFNFGIS